MDRGADEAVVGGEEMKLEMWFNKFMLDYLI